MLIFFFFFSSRRRHTRCYRDWSSDVCSSDLEGEGGLVLERRCVGGDTEVEGDGQARRGVVGDPEHTRLVQGNADREGGLRVVDHPPRITRSLLRRRGAEV